ncbi:MAG: 3-hydroxyisobutyrate dehydrogenase [Solirubrobacteraceae bacterium]|jgi:3-hydroxyisobutyrate dehydrogenase|nr:3-hydroxyisobutyrate dehydrogenase [Solirubrobacteraceae bacterium]
MSDRDVVAVLGAGGTMGMGMATNIARAGLPLIAWNRTREKAEPLSELGGRIVDTPAEAGAGSDVIVTMLTDGDAVLEAMQGDDGALSQAGEGCVWVQMSTIGERATQRCIELAQAAGVGFVDAPVSGTKQPAAEGKLVVMASGPQELRERVQPVFDAVGGRTLWVGDEPGAGTRLKLVTNAWLVAVAEGVAETIALAEGLGLDPALFLEAIDGGPLESPYARMKAKAMIDRDFTPSFALKLATKDAVLAVQSARERGLDLPVLEAISERMQQAVPEHGDEDLSATFLMSAPAR